MAALRSANIQVATINSTTPRAVKERVLADLQSGHPYTRLLYVTPEFCELDHFRRILHTIHTQRELSRIAIDEAHCISEWGHDFRPSFQRLCWFKQNFPDVPIMCLTATATHRVREDIKTTLALDSQTLKTFSMSTERPNLHYEVRFKSDQEDQYPDFLKWIRSVHTRRKDNPVRAAELKSAGKRLDNVSGIIYSLYRRDCETIAAQLCQDGIGAKPFHAGLSTADKDDHLQGWVENRPGYDVIVATTAFGMGIDKNNVRFVVHWQIPKSFEGYYQEAGRAGRDGKASVCMLYYGREDRDRAASRVASETRKMSSGNRRGSDDVAANPQVLGRGKSLQALVEYCENTTTCRHRAICQYFGEQTVPECDFACDWHKDAKSLVRRKDKGLASEEWCSTQRAAGTYANDEYG